MTRIIKYENRKMYDEGRARYVSMLELSGIVARGELVSVTSDRTGEDVTLVVLARALYERLKARRRKTDPFSPEVLARLIAKVRR